MKFSCIQIITHLASAVPFLWLVWDYYSNNLTANPIQAATLRTGKTALILLVLTLAVTPLNTLFKWREVLRVRRALGLWTFFYAAVHFTIFIGLDYAFQWEFLRQDLLEKRFAVVGFITGLIMVPLAITSTKGWQKRLKKGWKNLHKLVYAAGILAVVHYIWQVKGGDRQPIVFAGIVGFLLILRVPQVRQAVTRFRQGVVGRLAGG